MNGQIIWILKGYEMFAVKGESSIKVERLAKEVGISKSSFYHYFADLEIFIESLLAYHLEQSRKIAAKENAAVSIDPELIQILEEHKVDLLFNRQLRIHQNKPKYFDTLIRSNEILGDEFVHLWVRELNLKLDFRQLQGLFELALENFYLQISYENLQYNWLSNYFKNLKRIAANFSV